MRVVALAASLIWASLIAGGAAYAGETAYTGPGANITGAGLYSCIGMISVSGQGQVKNYFYSTGAFPAPRAQAQQLEIVT